MPDAVGHRRTAAGNRPRAPRDLNSDDADAILQVGTNIANVITAAKAERWFSKPVLCLNAVMYWKALRTCGIEDRMVDYGRILEEF